MDDKVLAENFSDLRRRLDLLDEKLDLVLKNCCTHSRTVASMKKGDPVVCEDCKTVVGVVR